MLKVLVPIVLLTTYALAQTGAGATYTIETTDSPAGTYTLSSGTTYNAKIMTGEAVVEQEAFGTIYGLRFGMLAAQLGTVPVYTPPAATPAPTKSNPIATYKGHRNMNGKGTIWACGATDINPSIMRSIFNLLVTALPLLLILMVKVNSKQRRVKVRAKR